MNTFGILFCLIFPLCIADDNITCYECSSLADGKCDDPFDSHEQGRHYNCSVCWKLKGDSDYYQKTLVQRGCDHTNGAQATGCHTRTQNGIAGDICYCSTHLCNSTVFVFQTVLPVVLLVLAQMFVIVE